MEEKTRGSEFSFEYERAEYLRAHRAIRRHAMRGRWMRRLVQIGLVLFGIFTVINMAADIQRGSYPAMLPGFLAVVALPFIHGFNGYMAALQWEKLNPVGHRTVTVRINEDRFGSASHVGAVELRWVATKQVVETSEFLLVYVTESVGYYVPVRAMSAVDRSHVRQLVRSQVDPKRVHLAGDGASAA